jgi:uncharacterized protein YqgC (DUF456 family)
MAIDIIVTVVAGILLAVAAFGTIYPILPGSPVAIVALIAWGWVLGSAASWTAALVGVLFATLGFSASALLTGRKMRQQRIPRRSIIVGVLCGIAGMFVIPVAGLFAGFAIGLFFSELVRQGDFQAALGSSLEALKATGLGMLIEFCMVALASSVWMIGVIVHFATR